MSPISTIVPFINDFSKDIFQALAEEEKKYSAATKSINTELSQNGACNTLRCGWGLFEYIFFRISYFFSFIPFLRDREIKT